MKIPDSAFSSLFETNMGIRPGERILVFTDTVRTDENPSPPDLARRHLLHRTAHHAAGYALKSYGNCRFSDFPATAASGVEPPESLWEATFGSDAVDGLKCGGLLARIAGKSHSPDDLAMAKEILDRHRGNSAEIIIALSNNSTSHTSYRRLACSLGARFASLPHFDPGMFLTSMCVDWHALSDRTRRVADAVNRAEWLTVECPNGTSMHICKKGRRAEGDDGILSEPGSFGNLPAGEAYFAPLEGESHGVMVIEWGPTGKLDSPLTLTISDGRVAAIEGRGRLRDSLEARFAASDSCRNLAELGIGTNERASRPDNVLEAEKIMGTVHMALGDNTGFGGNTSAPFHEDYVFYSPTVTLVSEDGIRECLIRDGNLQAG